MLVANLEQTCSACPTSWEFQTDGGRGVYVRYRWGTLRIDVDDVTIYKQKLGDAFDGSIDWETVEPIIHSLDVEKELIRANKENEEYEKAFASDPAFRRQVWRKQMEDINTFMLESNKVEDEMRGKGLNIPASSRELLSEEYINAYLEKAEAEFQANQANNSQKE